MSRKNSLPSILLLLVVFLLLLAFYIFTQRRTRDALTPVDIFPWSRDEIVRVERWFQTNILEHTVFEKREHQWYMLSPVEEPAHPELLHRLLNNLDRLQSERSFLVTNEADWQAFGFVPYEYRFLITTASGEALTFDIGGISVGENFYYLRISGNPTNYQVYTFNMIDLTLPQGSYRSPDIFNIPFDALERVVFFFRGSRATELANRQGEWEMVYPEKRSLTNFSVKSLLLDFYPLQANHFVTTNISPAILRQHDLTQPVYGLMFIGEGRSNTIWVSDTSKDGFLYAYSHERQGVFTVSEGEVTTKWVTQASQLRR